MGDFASKLKSLQITEEDALAALKSLKGGFKPRKGVSIPLSGKSFAFGYFSDAHIGHVKFHEELFEYMVKYFKREKPDFILNPGDHLEGMSGRPGHVYELNRIGFKQQFDYAVELYSQLEVPHYGIDGNHDQWYYMKGDQGIIVGDEFEKHVKNYHNLGQDEGNFHVDGIHIRLYHAGDGTAYADSYKLQKYIESLSGGEKPNIVLSGHYHKAVTLFRRGVWAAECGTLCGQSKWMKGKKTPAHMGFGFIRVYVNKKGVERLVHEFVPWHEAGE